MNCVVCNQPLKKGELIKHHISYNPESKIKVHRKCHFQIHNTDNFLELKPDKESIHIYYNGDPTIKNRFRPEISNELVNEVKILSENTTGSFEDSLKTLVDKYKKLRRLK